MTRKRVSMYSQTIYNKRKMLIAYWLQNLKDGNENQEILYIAILNIYKSFIDKITKEINQWTQNEYTILRATEWIKNKPSSVNNLILIGDYKSSRDIPGKSQKRILYVEFHPNIFITDFFHTEKIEKPKATEDEQIVLYLEQREPKDIVHKSYDAISYFLFNYGGYNSISTLLKDTNLNLKAYDLIEKRVNLNIVNEETKHLPQPTRLTIQADKSIQDYYIKKDITILEEKGILTSRLSIAIYRQAMLDTSANKTEIGRYFSKALGNTSKIVDLKKICKGSSTDYDKLTKTKVKAYDLNIKPKSIKTIRNELELEIKEHIAKKLIYFTDIDIDTVQRIVELPKSALKSFR